MKISQQSLLYQLENKIVHHTRQAGEELNLIKTSL